MAPPVRKFASEADPFDVSQVLADQKTAQENISDLSQRLLLVETKLSNSSQFATFLEGVADESMKVHAVFKKVFDRFIGEDDTKKKILAMVDDKDRDYTGMTLKRFGGWVGRGVIFILGIIVTEFVRLIQHGK